MLGKVMSFSGTPTTREFYFVVTGSTVVGDVVSVPDGKGRIVAMVEEIMSLNRLMENPDAVKEGISADEWTTLVAKARILGRLDGRPSRNQLPPLPGSSVERIGRDELEVFFGIGGELNIGTSSGYEVRLDMEKLIQRHVAVVAMSGAGKSHFVKVLLEELLKSSSPAIVLFDVHGEYAGFLDDEMGRNVRVVDASSIRFSWGRAKEVLHLLKPTKAEIRELRRVGYNPEGMRDNDKLFHLYDELSSLHLFGDADTLTEMDIRLGRLVIIDMSRVLSNRKRALVAHFISSMVFNGRREGRVPPTFLIFEEAHNFAPEGSSQGFASLSKRTIETISREGRKFGVSICLVSQRPVRLSTTALSQCSTKVIFRMTNPYDVDHVKRSSESLSQELSSMIPGLRTGEAIIMGEAVRHPMVVQIREREAKEREDRGLREMISEWKDRKRAEERDIEAFL